MDGSKEKIIDFPKTLDHQLEEVFKLDESGDTKGAIEEAKRLIDEGHSEVYGIAGYLYESGDNKTQEDYDNALFYYHKCIEEYGAVESFLALGRMYYFGKGITPDYESAYKHYEHVRDENDHPIAYLMLGKMYQNGEFVETDLDKAEEYFKTAYGKGNILGLSNLAILEQKRGNYIKSIIIRFTITWDWFISR